MKTKEEIEQLANEFTTRDHAHYFYRGRDAYIKAYTQCQEDMFQSLLANTLRNLYADKKYTEDDIRKAIEVGINAEAGDYPEGFNYKLGITLEDYFINSLNKQD